jgi:hypothetical protein
MKRFALLALAALLFVPVSVNAQMKNENLGKKYGNYEIKLTKDKWTSSAVVSAIWDNATSVWVTAPKLKNKEGSLVFLPNTDVDFIQGEDYVPEAQGLVVVGNGYRYDKGVENPKQKWLIRGAGVFRIEDDKLVPVVVSGDALDVAYLWEARYTIFRVIPGHKLILGAFHPKDKEGYSIFNLEGERLYNDLKDWKFKEEPSLYIQLEDGSWHHLDPADGSMLD